MLHFCLPNIKKKKRYRTIIQKMERKVAKVSSCYGYKAYMSYRNRCTFRSVAYKVFRRKMANENFIVQVVFVRTIFAADMAVRVHFDVVCVQLIFGVERT